MQKDNKAKQQQMRARIAAAAARIMAEDGIDDFALAKRKAVRQLGAENTQSLPKNEEIESELRSYQALYQGQEQRERVQYLRQRALDTMRFLAQFHPYLSGPVLKGTAGRYCDIDLQLFTDDFKSVELFLLAHNIGYEVCERRYFTGDTTRIASILKFESRGVPVNLTIYSLNDERSALKISSEGRSIERAGIQAVVQPLANESG